MSDWNIDKLKKILCPLGLTCGPYGPIGEYIFSFKNHNFLVYDANRDYIYINARTKNHVSWSVQCYIYELRFDLVVYAKEFIQCCKHADYNNAISSINKDFDESN